jgi:hypothetical protein
MRLDDLEAELPNGLHDAIVSSYAFLEAERQVDIDLSIWIGDPAAQDHATRERHAKARLQLLGVTHWQPEPPHPQSFGPTLRGVCIDTCAAESTTSTPIAEGCFAGRLFVVEWNAFIHFVAQDVGLTWVDGN